MAARESAVSAVVAKLDADVAVLAALAGGVWHDEVPEDKELPWARVYDVSGDVEADTGGSYVEKQRVAVVAYAVSDVTAETNAGLIDAALDRQALSFTDGSTHLATLKQSPQIRGEDFRAKDGRKVFGATRQFAVLIERTR